MDTGNFFKELDSIFKTGSIKDAEIYLTASLERAAKEDDLAALLAVSNELGGVFRVTSRLAEAKKIYGAAVEIIRQLGLENTEQHGTTLLNLGSVHTEAGDPSEAVRLYEKAATVFGSTGLEQDYRMAALYNNMSHAYEKLGDQEKALAYAEKALAIIRGLKGFDVELATSCTTLASRLLKQMRYEEAWNLLGEAEDIFRRHSENTDPHYAATLNAKGEICYRRGDLDQAREYYKKALEIVRKHYGENQFYREVAGNLARAEAAGNIAGSPEKIRMSGLELAEAYYNEYGRKLVEEDFADYKRYIAVGLVGEGSECFGFDDELSESHDYGPGFCIWLPDEIYKSIGWKLKDAYDKLPKTYLGRRRMETAEGTGRVGVFSIGDFYRKYTGCVGIPESPVSWIFTPETSLATVTNGKIFEDSAGEFTRIRNGLLDFYPKDVLLKKLAARMAMMSQTGQYNYERCMKRKEFASAYLSCSEFIRTAVSAVYLLNRRYMPFYKWMFRGMEPLERLREVKPILEKLALLPDIPENTQIKVSLIEDVCVMIRDELERQGIVKSGDPFLNSHCRDVMSLISDPQIRNLPVMFDGR